ncbi:hypothetical protein [Oceanobacillus sp. Castelsardo]|uniref:helix-turn-helix transcriptional regulator n=1 Tax=Oceanobacillus sp. Castelsardo TaxID=1851204 RepID=UPI0008380E50|nr:hypothetical protein [Oceanobacillus sp. Castelsardo]
MRRNWTSDEITYLKDSIGLYKLTTIARNLDRSYDSVRVKMTRLSLSNTKAQTGYITFHELAQLLKVDRNTVKGWAMNYKLPYIKKATRARKYFYFIDPPAFWDWAEQHKDKVQFSNIDPQSIPPEPEWVERERRKDTYSPKKRRYQKWTTKEETCLIELRKSGLTFKEISEKMGRSPISVERHYKRVLNN